MDEDDGNVLGTNVGFLDGNELGIKDGAELDVGRVLGITLGIAVGGQF